jgi:tRNA1(Val) A37 N6-methylase TrmN6
VERGAQARSEEKRAMSNKGAARMMAQAREAMAATLELEAALEAMRGARRKGARNKWREAAQVAIADAAVELAQVARWLEELDTTVD